MIPQQVWLYDEVKDHWDEIQLKCWVTKDGKRSLYQEATLAALMSPEEWKPIFKKLGIENLNNSVFFSGTINTVGKQLIYADSYELEMIDPVLKRTLRHEYRASQADRRDKVTVGYGRAWAHAVLSARQEDDSYGS